MEKPAGDGVSIHGVRLERINKTDAANNISIRLRRDSAELPFAVFTPNAEIIYRCSKDSRLAALVNSCDLSVADGVGAIWAARLLGTPLPERIPGIELAEAVFGNCAGDGTGVYLLGGRPGVAHAASVRLASRFPGLNISGTHHGYFDPHGAENDEAVRRIYAAAPGLLVVCLGFPRQEEWIAANRASLPHVRVMMALGGSLDVWSGQVRRAPAPLRSAGLEWLWRAATNPVRFGRVASLPAFIGLTLREKKRKESSHERSLS